METVSHFSSGCEACLGLAEPLLWASDRFLAGIRWHSGTSRRGSDAHDLAARISDGFAHYLSSARLAVYAFATVFFTTPALDLRRLLEDAVRARQFGSGCLFLVQTGCHAAIWDHRGKDCRGSYYATSSTYAPPTAQDIETVSSLFSLPPAFVFYPAQTWPHQHHISLLKALAWLRDRRGIVVPFVSSGFCNDFFPTIQAAIRELRLDAQVKFLGFVSTLQMQCLYTLSRCVVIPTKFEAASFPLWEAFLAGVPAACSNVTSLPEQAGDAALIFDPENIEQIAKAIETLWINESLRADLSARGRAKVAQFSWNTTARTFRSHYRRLANRDQTDEDHLLFCTASPAI